MSTSYQIHVENVEKAQENNLENLYVTPNFMAFVKKVDKYLDCNFLFDEINLYIACISNGESTVVKLDPFQIYNRLK